MEKVNNEYVAALISSCSMGSYGTILEILRKRDEFVENGSKESVGDDYPGITAEHLEAIARNSQADSENLFRLDALLSAQGKASAAPEQGAVAWRGINELGEVVTEWVDGQPPESMVDLCGNPDSYASIELSYTHADPSELELLRAELERIERRAKNAELALRYQTENCESASQRASAAEWKLANAQAQILTMHRELHALVPDGYTDPEAPLSATAQPAECSTPTAAEPKETWLDMEELPDRAIGARYRMILDNTPQNCVEIDMEGTEKRWFYGDENGAYPIDEIQAWLPTDGVNSHD